MNARSVHITAMLSRKISRWSTTDSGERPKRTMASPAAHTGSSRRRARTWTRTALTALTSSITNRMEPTVISSGAMRAGIQVSRAICTQPNGGWSYQYV